MNVLLLSQFFSTSKGGGEYVFNILAKSLANNGHKVWVMTNRIIDEKYPNNDNIEMIFVPPELEYKGGLPTSFYENLQYIINVILKAPRIIKKQKIDIIHSNNFSPTLAGAIVSSIIGKPHITTIHDIFSLCGKDYWKKWGRQKNVSKINTFLGPFVEKLMIKLNHNAVHTVSNTSKNDLIKFGEKKPIYVIPNALEVDYKKSKENPLQFTFIGRLVFYKNLEVIIKAIAIIKEKYSKISLKIIGDGPHRKILEELVNELGLQSNIEFCGHVSSEEKIRILSESKALVFPSLCEGFGLVVLEAFSQMKPVLVANIAPLSEIVSDKINGYVVSPYDPSDWVNAIDKIINDEKNATKMGLAGRKLLEKKYNVQNMLNEILNMYNFVLGKNS